MSTAAFDVHDLPARFAEALARAAAGDEVMITENEVPRARLLSLGPGQPRILGLHPGAITMAPDFDEPLPDDFWLGRQ